MRAATLRGKTQPNRVTWFMWGVAPLIGTAAQLSGGVGWSTLALFMTGFGPVIIFICSFANKKAYWKTSIFDYLCGVLAVCGLLGWFFTRNQDVAIAFSIGSDFLAAVPTLRKCWTHPESENGPTFMYAALAALLGVLCVQQPTFTAYGFISYLLFIDCALLALIYRKKLNALLQRVRV